MRHAKGKRTNRKPPKGSRCDATVGVDSSRKAPRLIPCPNLATVELVGLAPVGESWLCEDCAQKLQARADA